MSTSDPILYPAPHDTVEGLRQDIQRTRAELVDTLEELAGRVSPRRVTRPATALPIAGSAAAGLAAFLLLRRIPVLRAVAALGAIGAAASTLVAVRRAGRPPTPKPARADREDVVTVLIEQHQVIERGFADVAGATGPDRLEEFAKLAELLRHHERVEQEWIHPLLESVADDVANARLAEEKSAERTLASLISRGVDHPEFEVGLQRLRELIRNHAAHEESYEFPLLRRHIDRRRLGVLAGQLRWLG